MVVGRVEQLQVQDAGDALDRLAADPLAAAANRVVVGFGPAVGAGDDPHAVGTQQVEALERAVDGHRVEVDIAGDALCYACRHHLCPRSSRICSDFSMPRSVATTSG